jgi:outer membrane protein assembly factor BamA
MSTITIKITETNPFKLKNIQTQLEAIAKLDEATLTKLTELAKSKNAPTLLKDNWGFIKSMM